MRYLGQVDGRTVYAACTVGEGDSEVCLAISDANGAAMGCTSEGDFRRRRIQIFSGSFGVGWGPAGQEIWTSTLAG